MAKSCFGPVVMGCDSSDWSIQRMEVDYTAIYYIKHTTTEEELFVQGHIVHKHQDLLKICSISILKH